MDKTEVVRRQLGTALHLFIQDADPVSVHTLACAACEIAEHLPLTKGRTPFATHALAAFPDLDIAAFHSIQRKHFNAFKHMNRMNGQERDDSQLLGLFSDEQNDGALFIGWYDYSEACGSQPLAAQVFQIWFFALHQDKFSPRIDCSRFDKIFPWLKQLSRKDQKKRLREFIEYCERDQSLMNDARTDPRPLLLTV